jgi:phosphoserine aminotransferase
VSTPRPANRRADRAASLPPPAAPGPPDGTPAEPHIPGIRIPAGLLPADGRFGSGPSKVPAEAVQALVSATPALLGTSHRQAPVTQLVGRIQAGLAELWALPDGYRVVLGNGGSTAFWDVATFCLVAQRSQHVVFGEFSAAFADAVAAAPHLGEPDVIAADYGCAAEAVGRCDVDLYALTHNETSTGVATTPTRPAGARTDALVAVDATSAAGAMPWDPDQVDAYYFAPQKVFAADGGLWLAVLSPAAIERAGALRSGGRWAPPTLDLTRAVERSAANQTLNTPALATLVLLAHQLDWLLENGGLEFAIARCGRSAATLYGWAEASAYARPFVENAAARSPVVATIDLDPAVPARTVSAVLRANGIVDTDSYRKLGRNQLRIGMFPAVDPADVEALTACIDHVVSAL